MNFIKIIFFNRGIAKDQKGTLKDNLDLIDLLGLRVHSDDLRADGQEFNPLIVLDKNLKLGQIKYLVEQQLEQMDHNKF